MPARPALAVCAVLLASGVSAADVRVPVSGGVSLAAPAAVPTLPASVLPRQGVAQGAALGGPSTLAPSPLDRSVVGTALGVRVDGTPVTAVSARAPRTAGAERAEASLARIEGGVVPAAIADAGAGSAGFGSAFDGGTLGRPPFDAAWGPAAEHRHACVGCRTDDDAGPDEPAGAPLAAPGRLGPLLPSDREANPHRWTGRVTLHLHSVYSDGTREPEDVVEAAHAKGVRSLALTEHDTTVSTLRAWRRAKALGMEYHTGVEITVRGGAHVNAVDVDVFHPSLVALLARARVRRYHRAEALVRAVNDLEELRSRGIVVTMDEVVAKSRHHEGGTIVRPHVARVLVDKGLANGVDEAFARFLDRLPAEGPEPDPAIEEVLAAVHDAGGAAFLNHPTSVDGKDEADKDARVVGLLRAGMDGIEVYRPIQATTDKGRRRADARAAKYLGWVDEMNLLASAGSDYHGEDSHLDELVAWMPTSLEAQLRAGLAQANARAIAALEAADAKPAGPPPSGTGAAGLLFAAVPASAFPIHLAEASNAHILAAMAAALLLGIIPSLFLVWLSHRLGDSRFARANRGWAGLGQALLAAGAVLGGWFWLRVLLDFLFGA